MVFWLLTGLALYYLGVFLPSLFLIPAMGLGAYMGSRDHEPAPTPLHARAIRANRNFGESLAAFLFLGLAALALPGADGALALAGAQLFVLARLAYLPLYLAAVPVLRSLAFTAGFAGLLVMALALI